MKRRRMHLYNRQNSDNFWFKMRVAPKTREAMNGNPVLICSQHGNGYADHLTATPCVGEFLNFSLQTADDGIAGSRGRDAEEHIERLFRLFEADPVTANQHDRTGLAGV